MPHTCATCKTAVAPRPENPFFPFCSERCRLVDLGRWLGEEYRIPSDEPADPADLAHADLDPTLGKPN